MQTIMFFFLVWNFLVAHRGREQEFPDNSANFLLIAHRGAQEIHLENTSEALLHAFEIGADGVEFDVQLSRDLVPVVFHDENLYRLAQKNILLKNTNWVELKKNKLKTSRYIQEYKISSLEEILIQLPANKIINIELKSTTNNKTGLQKIIKILNKFGDKFDFIISSFEPEILLSFGELTSGYKLGLLLGERINLLKIYDYKKIMGKIDFLHPHIKLVNNITGGLIKQQRVPLVFWGHKKIGQEKVVKKYKFYGLISDQTQKLSYERRL